MHHLLIYECHNRGQFNDSHYGAGYDCHDYANMPPILECYLYNIVAAWAVGAKVGRYNYKVVVKHA